MTRDQAQLVRLLLVCAAWAAGQTASVALDARAGGVIVPALLAVGVYILTGDLGRSTGSGGGAKYWRGRRIDDDERSGGRWH